MQSKIAARKEIRRESVTAVQSALQNEGRKENSSRNRSKVGACVSLALDTEAANQAPDESQYGSVCADESHTEEVPAEDIDFERGFVADNSSLGDQMMGDILEILALTQADKELFQEELHRSERLYFEHFIKNQNSRTTHNVSPDSTALQAMLRGGAASTEVNLLEQALETERREKAALQDELKHHKVEFARLKADMVSGDNNAQRQVLALKQQVKRLTARVTQNLTTPPESTEAATSKSPKTQQRERALSIIAQPKANSRRSQSAKWQKLATQEVLEASCPPETYPIPARVRGLSSEVESLQGKVKALNDQLLVTKAENEKLRRENDKHQRDGHQQLHEAREKIRRQEPQLTGAMRRINWLVEEKTKLEKEARESGCYAERLEKKLIEKDDEVQKLRKKLQTVTSKGVKASKGGFSYWQNMASLTQQEASENADVTRMQVAKLANFSPGKQAHDCMPFGASAAVPAAETA